MADNKPPFFHHFSRLDIFRGLLLSPKKQTGDGFEHYCFLFVSSRAVPSLLPSPSPFPSLFSRKLRCCQSLYLLKIRKQSHAHVHTVSLPPFSNANSNPSSPVWEWVRPRDPSLVIIFQNSSNMGQLTRSSNEISLNTVI